MIIQIKGIKLENLNNHIESKEEEFNIYELMTDIWNELDFKKDIIIVKFKKTANIEILAANNFRCGTCDCCINPSLNDNVTKDDIEVYKISLDIDFSE